MIYFFKGGSIWTCYQTFSNFNKHKNTSLTNPHSTFPQTRALRNSGYWPIFNTSIINHSSLLFKSQNLYKLEKGHRKNQSSKRKRRENNSNGQKMTTRHLIPVQKSWKPIGLIMWHTCNQGELSNSGQQISSRAKLTLGPAPYMEQWFCLKPPASDKLKRKMTSGWRNLLWFRNVRR